MAEGMPFRPINEDHAIETVVFSISLKMPLSSQSINAARAEHRLWRRELPAVQNSQNAELSIIDGAASVARVAGVEFSFLRPNGLPSWVMRLLGKEISIECHLYTRWNKVSDRSFRYLSQLLPILIQHQKDQSVTDVALIYHDRFRAADESYDLHDLFVEGDFTPPFMFKAKPTWHQHCGWFRYSPDHIVLNNLNIDAVRQENIIDQDLGPSGLYVRIVHLQKCSWRTSISLADLVSGDGEKLKDAFESMHLENKHVLSQIINSQMANAIKLMSNGNE